MYTCTDLDWASNPDDWHLQTGYYLMITGGIFSWATRAQRTIALSSTKAKYMVLSDCSCQCVWICSIFLELGYLFGPISISSDNQGSIFMASNLITKVSNKHIDVRYHVIFDFITQGKIKLSYIKGSENPANMFTQNLGQAKFCKFWNQLGIIFY